MGGQSDPLQDFGETISVTAPSAGAGIGSIFGPVGTIAGGALGSLVSGLFGSSQANKANAFTERMADKQMAFQERMSNTAYQRQVSDMRAAGLNPIMAAMRGGGASSPSGAGGSGQQASADVGQVGPAIGASAKMLAMEMPRLKSEIAVNTASKQKMLSDADLNDAQREQLNWTRSQIDQTNAESRAREESTRRMTEAQVDEARARAELARSSAALNDTTARGISQDIGGKRGFWNEAFGVGTRTLQNLRSGNLDMKLMDPSKVFESGGGNVFGGANSGKRVRYFNTGPGAFLGGTSMDWTPRE